MKFEALIETMRDKLNAKGPTTLEDLNKAMVTSGESPNRRIEKKDFFEILIEFEISGNKKDRKILDENLCFETNGEVNYDKFWTALNK